MSAETLGMHGFAVDDIAAAQAFYGETLGVWPAGPAVHPQRVMPPATSMRPSASVSAT